MKKSCMSKITFIASVVAACSMTSAFANNVNLQVTASTTVGSIPANFSEKRFVVEHYFQMSRPHGFDISSTPTTQSLVVDSKNFTPAFELTDHTAGSPNNGLTWYFYCQGLTFNYGSNNNNATVVFSGQITPNQPGTDVTCTCTGPICSTTATLPAKLVLR